MRLRDDTRVEGIMAKALAGRLLEWDMFPFPEPLFFHSRHLPRLLKDRWDYLCREAATTRRVKELHAARPDLLAVLDQIITLHKSYLGLLDLHEQFTGRDGYPRELREDLTRAIEETIRLRDDIFSNWHTADDLARILIEKFSLPADKLREVAAKHPPPESWFEETADPFSAD
jgi:hypothetical protein